MKIFYKQGRTRKENLQLIIVDRADKYGIAMLAYFKNSLGGKNVQRLAVTDDSKVQLFFNRLNNTYTLQIKSFSVAKECILSNYANFKTQYDLLIRDKLSHI